MKKVIAMMFSLLVVMGLSACGDNPEILKEEPQNRTTQMTENTGNESTLDVTERKDTELSSKENKILIAYFSRADNIEFDENVDAVASASINFNGDEIDGNTRLLALACQEAIGGELFSIKTVEKYPTSYDDTVDVAKQEQNDNARPALSTHVEDMNTYDIIILIYPNWWGTLPQPVFAFLEEYDFPGKTVLPLCTHEGSGLGNSEETITSLCPDSELLEGLAVRGSNAGTSQDDVNEWIRKTDIRGEND